MMDVSGSTVFVLEGDVVACEISSGSAVLNLKTSRYFSLNPTAAVLWDALQEREDKAMAVDEMCAVLVARYDISREDCYSDVVSIFTQFEKTGLVRIKNS